MMKMVGSINRSAIIIMEIPNNIHTAKMANIHMIMCMMRKEAD